MTSDLNSKRGPGPETESSARIELVWDAAGIGAFFPLLQDGFFVKVRLGSSVRDVLCRQLGVEDDYLDNRINTLFLDGKPVDDVDSAILGDGSVLALSASMPGFAGAALRKGGFFAGMRYTISHTDEGSAGPSQEGLLCLKLYNFTISELGPGLLARCVWVKAEDLQRFFRDRSERFWSACLQCRVDGQDVPVSELRLKNWGQPGKLVPLRVTSRSEI